ncbi:MAG: hypothetical protein NUV57_02085 [archaeon]|nr:hypothetical protein [archaeon]
MAKDKKDKKEEKTKAPPKKKTKTTDKWKKKSWYAIIAPEEFERKQLGETIVEKPENLIGRVIHVTGRELANQPKKQHIQLKFKVRDITGNKANTEVVGHEVKDSYLKRIIRRRASKIMTVKNYTTKDNKIYKIKIIIITENKASRNQKTSIMKQTEEATKKIISELDSRKVIDEIVFGTIPNKIYGNLKSIVPVKRIEITKSALVV